MYQCQSRDRGGETFVSGRLQEAALPGDCDGGFYEWQVQDRTKQPMWIGLKSHRPFAFAGLWEHWQPAEGEVIESCTILATEPNELMKQIHNRMPVMLPPRLTTCGSAPLPASRISESPASSLFE